MRYSLVPAASAPRGPRVLSVGLSAALWLCAACGGDAATPAEGADAPAAGFAAVDSATLSENAVAIAGFEVDTAHRRPWRTVVAVPGRMQLDPEAFETIGSITEGRITHVTVQVGDRVRAGQGLVFIHSHEIMDARSALAGAAAALEAAEAERALAVSAAERAQRLFESKAMSRAELDRAVVARTVATSAHARAVSERDRAAALVEHLAGTGALPRGADEHDVIVRTPIAGVVTSRVAQPGTVVLPGTPLLTVGEPSRLQIEMHVPEHAASGIRPGHEVRYATTDAPDDRRTAFVTRVAPTVDSLTRTVQVIARPRGEYVGRAESFVHAEIRGVQQDSVVQVPASAVMSFDGDTVVFMAQYRGEGALYMQAMRVRVGRRTSEYVEVLAGLEPGTTVISRGAAIAKAELLRRRGGDGAGEH